MTDLDLILRVTLEKQTYGYWLVCLKENIDVQKTVIQKCLTLDTAKQEFNRLVNRLNNDYHILLRCTPLSEEGHFIAEFKPTNKSIAGR